jgi:hypothetical protein
MMHEHDMSRRRFLETGTVSIGALTLGVRQVTADVPASLQGPVDGGRRTCGGRPRDFGTSRPIMKQETSW